MAAPATSRPFHLPLDTLTHALSGALCARATAPRHEPGVTLPVWRRVLVGACAATFPDLDFVAGYISPLTYLQLHRGITHSFVMLPVWTLLLAWIASKVWRDGLGMKPYLAVIALGLGLHIVGDWITSFGTMFLAPLSDRRFALSTTFIIDLFVTGIIVAGLLGSALWRRSCVPSVAAMLTLAGYVAFQGLMRQQAIEFGMVYAKSAGLGAARVDAIPRPVSPFNWFVVVEQGDRLDTTSINLVRAEPRVAAPDAGFLERLSAPYRPLALAEWSRFDRFGQEPRAGAIAQEAFSSQALGVFRWFADYPVLQRVDVDGGRTCAWFRDLRFVTPGRDIIPFQYAACRVENGPWEPWELDEAGGMRPLR